jgi:hypothetical protein
MLPLLKNVITSPPSVFVRRNDLRHEPEGFPYDTVPIIPDVRVEQAPNPYPSATLFAGIGRDAAHAPTPLRTWLGGLAIPEWLSVMQWPFAAGRPLTAVRVDMPRGVQNPIQERSVINSPGYTSLGSMTTVAVAATTSPGLEKISF